PREVVVEGRDRVPVQDRVVGAAWIRRQEPAPDDLQIQPARAARRRGSEPPRGARRAVALADVPDLHPPFRYVPLRRASPTICPAAASRTCCAVGAPASASSWPSASSRKS